MKCIYKSNKLIISLIVLIAIILSFLVANKNNIDIVYDNTISYINESDIEKIKFKDDIVVLSKIDLDVKQRVLLDVDKNNNIDINDLYIAKDIINGKIKDNKKTDLNYDKKIDSFDSDLLTRYKSGVIDLDINMDNKEDLEDINLLDLYINSYKQLEVLVPKDIDKSLVNLEVEDKDIISIDEKGIVYAKKEGITKVKVVDNKDNVNYCTVIVIDYNQKEKEISTDREIIYLRPTHLTTVEKSTSDLSRDNNIDVLDYEILLKIINHSFGDINKDGITDQKDVKVLKNHLNKKDKFNSDYDLNYDGYINNTDLDLLNSFLSPILIGDINKDTMVENRDIKIINKASYSYDTLNYKVLGFTPNKYIEYRISDSNVATINNEGLINAIKEGETTITMISKNGKKKSFKVISSENNNLPISIEVDKDRIDLEVFDNKNIDISCLDLNNDGVIDNTDLKIYKNIKNMNNKKTLNKLLDSIIDKKYNKSYDFNNDKELNLKDYSILCNYMNNKEKEKLSESIFNKYLNSSTKLNIKLNPNNVVNKIVYTSKNSNIATVNSEGLVKAISKGETEIISISVNDIRVVTKVTVN